jgi:hypothetical protein
MHVRVRRCVVRIERRIVVSGGRRGVLSGGLRRGLRRIGLFGFGWRMRRDRRLDELPFSVQVVSHIKSLRSEDIHKQQPWRQPPAVICGTVASPSPKSDKITPEPIRPEIACRPSYTTDRLVPISTHTKHFPSQTRTFSSSFSTCPTPTIDNHRQPHIRNGCHHVRFP